MDSRMRIPNPSASERRNGGAPLRGSESADIWNPFHPSSLLTPQTTNDHAVMLHPVVVMTTEVS